MKKLLVLLLILALSIGAMGCGSDDKLPSPESGDGATDNQQGDSAGDDQSPEETEGDGDESGEPGTIDIDNLTMSEEGQEQYDFGFKASIDFGMSGAVKKVSYDDLSIHVDTVESMLDKAAKKALKGNYVLMGDYEEDDTFSIDKQAYVMGVDDDDIEKSSLEAGVYHNADDDKHYQYVCFFSANYYEKSSANIKEALSQIKDGFGITVSQSKVEKALEKAWKKSEETEDFYTLYQRKTIKGDGYTETVSFGVEVFVLDGMEAPDGSGANRGFYLSAERERCYQ